MGGGFAPPPAIGPSAQSPIRTSREAREAPEGRPARPGDPESPRVSPLAISPLPGPPGLPSGSGFPGNRSSYPKSRSARRGGEPPIARCKIRWFDGPPGAQHNPKMAPGKTNMNATMLHVAPDNLHTGPHFLSNPLFVSESVPRLPNLAQPVSEAGLASF